MTSPPSNGMPATNLVCYVDSVPTANAISSVERLGWYDVHQGLFLFPGRRGGLVT